MSKGKLAASKYAAELRTVPDAFDDGTQYLVLCNIFLSLLVFPVRPRSLSACCGVFFKVNVGYVAKNTLRMGRKEQTHNGNRHGSC